jgi:glyoxylase-like metal-dependent hydrolase (beta-lactamase superfamily II)
MSERIGDITIDRIVESICPDFEPMDFFPETTPDDWARHREWMQPTALDPDSGNIILTIQAFLVRTRHHTIVIDTCVGDHKPRPHRPGWHMTKLDTFLPRLAAAGVSPADVDYVMCTHLHWDHVGWNTQLRNGRWVPTFPNATYIFAQREVEAWKNMSGDVPQDHMQDSVLPVIEAGQAQLVANDFALNDEVWLSSTPGHTPDHVSVHLTSQGARAMITGTSSTARCSVWNRSGSCAPTLTRNRPRPPGKAFCSSTVRPTCWSVRRISRPHHSGTSCHAMGPSGSSIKNK